MGEGFQLREDLPRLHQPPSHEKCEERDLRDHRPVLVVTVHLVLVAAGAAAWVIVEWAAVANLTLVEVGTWDGLQGHGNSFR
mmetsp:Transcript_723/g.1504  ORF Transcript_723/g.1504 Transcript_723/m.1504 type:complete len:82 (+) Transcript_723:1978-2223(+)